MELSLPLSRRMPGGETRPRALSDTRSGAALAWLRANRLAMRVTIGVSIALPVLGGGWLWLRDSSLVAVRHVHITGVHGVEAIEIRQALDSAATRMTTMDVSEGALRASVSSFAIVGALHVRTSFPHTLSISVSERPPVAALLSAGQRTAVAADGTVLGPALLSGLLPTINGSIEPPVGGRLTEPAALAAVTVLGAAPAVIASFVVRVFNGPEGLTVSMRNGLVVYFGDSLRPHAKWLSLARVLTSPASAGAVYVDVRLPERPAAGFSSTSASSSTPTSSTSPASSAATSTPMEVEASNPTTAALAASLEKAAGGSAGASSGTSTTSGSGESETSSGSSTTPESEASSGSSPASGSSESETSAGASEASETPVG